MSLIFAFRHGMVYISKIIHRRAHGFGRRSFISGMGLNTKTIRYGETWRLDRYRLMCGDSTNKESVRQFIGEEKIQMIMTDPPYNMSYSGGGCFEKETQKARQRIAKIIDFNANNVAFYTEMDIPSVYIFTSKTLVRDYLNIFEGYHSTILVWCKTNPTPFVNSSFLPNLEYMLYFAKPGKKIWNKGLKPLSIYSRYYISAKEEGKKDAGDLHPTMKPIKLFESKILISSSEGGTVFDGFGGSGTTLIACEKIGRRCFMIEYEPEYCDVIIRRWAAFTGGKAVKE